MADADQAARDRRLADAVAAAVHALNAALDDARLGGLTCDISPNVRPLAGGARHVSVNASVVRQRVEFERRI